MADGATVGDLRRLLETSLKVPYHDQTLSLDQALVRRAPAARASGPHAPPARRSASRGARGTALAAVLRARANPRWRFARAAAQLLAPEPSAFRDMANERATLASLGVAHGSLVYFRYSVQREVTPNAVSVASRPFGAHMTIAEMVLRQVRVERQDKPRCASLSFDGQAANVFQACVPAPRPRPLRSPPAAHAPLRGPLRPQLREPGAGVFDTARRAAVRDVRR